MVVEMLLCEVRCRHWVFRCFDVPTTGEIRHGCVLANNII